METAEQQEAHCAGYRGDPSPGGRRGGPEADGRIEKRADRQGQANQPQGAVPVRDPRSVLAAFTLCSRWEAAFRRADAQAAGPQVWIQYGEVGTASTRRHADGSRCGR